MLDEQLMISLSQVLQIMPVSRGLIYRLINEQNFPLPKKLPGCKKSFWVKADVEQWVKSNLK